MPASQEGPIPPIDELLPLKLSRDSVEQLAELVKDKSESTPSVVDSWRNLLTEFGVDLLKTLYEFDLSHAEESGQIDPERQQQAVELLRRLENLQDDEELREELLDDLWVKSPPIAELVDQLLDRREPGWLIFGSCPTGPAARNHVAPLFTELYLFCESRFRLAQEMLGASPRFVPKFDRWDRRLLLTAQATPFARSVVGKLWGAFALTAAQDAKSSGNAPNGQLLRFGAVVSAFFFYVEIFFLLPSAFLASAINSDERLSNFPVFGDAATFFRSLGIIGTEGLGETLPGFIVATSFALIAITYYFNIFVLLDASGSPRARSMNLAVRSLPVTLNIPIVAGFLIPSSLLFLTPTWPWIAAAGMMAPLAANATAVAFVQRTHREAVKENLYSSVQVKKAMYNWVTEFAEWRNLVAWYIVGLFIIALMFQLGILGDEWFFVILVALAGNIVKLYGSNVRKRGPNVAGNIGRLILYARRLDLIDESEPAAASLPRRRDRLASALERVAARLRDREPTSHSQPLQPNPDLGKSEAPAPAPDKATQRQI